VPFKTAWAVGIKAVAMRGCQCCHDELGLLLVLFCCVCVWHEEAN